MQYFISDPHMGHYNCIRFDNRPFKDVEEMNNEMISAINKRCKADDDLYILGDFCMRPAMYALWAEKINAKKHLILGNHDNEKAARASGAFVEIVDYKRLILPNPVVAGTSIKVILSHYPMVSWDGQMYGAIHIYGHVHVNEVIYVYGPDGKQQLLDLNNIPNAYNACCVKQKFVPWTLEDYVTKYGYKEDIYIPYDKKDKYRVFR